MDLREDSAPSESATWNFGRSSSVMGGSVMEYHRRPPPIGISPNESMRMIEDADSVFTQTQRDSMLDSARHSAGKSVASDAKSRIERMIAGQ